MRSALLVSHRFIAFFAYFALYPELFDYYSPSNFLLPQAVKPGLPFFSSFIAVSDFFFPFAFFHLLAVFNIIEMIVISIVFALDNLHHLIEQRAIRLIDLCASLVAVDLLIVLGCFVLSPFALLVVGLLELQCYLCLVYSEESLTILFIIQRIVVPALSCLQVPIWFTNRPINLPIIFLQFLFNLLMVLDEWKDGLLCQLLFTLVN